MTTSEDKTYAVEKQFTVESNLTEKHDCGILLPQPLPILKAETIPLEPAMLPEAIRDYVLDIAERQQCPIDFVAVTALCGLAAVLGRKAIMYPKQNDDWAITPNLWGVIIGRPSAMKSPAMKAALEPLLSFDSIAAEEHKSGMTEFKINKEFAELSKITAKEKAKVHINNKKDEAAKSELRAALFNEASPTRKRLAVYDASVEKLGELLNENPNGLLLIRDELSGMLAKLAREEHQMDRSFYLQCFDGNGRYIYDRISRGTIDIQNTTLSLIGGIQPSQIAPLIRDAIRGKVDDGLVQRLQLAVYPEDVKSWKWVDREPNQFAKEKYLAAFDMLYQYQVINEAGYLSCRFSPEAQRLFQDWMEEIQKTARAEDIHPALESHLLKMQKTVPALALLFQLLDTGFPENPANTYFVDECAIAKALDWADYLKVHALRLYMIASNQGLEGAHLILKRIDKLENEFTAREVQRRCWSGLTDQSVVEEALNYLVDCNHLISCHTPPTYIGRPTIYYQKNPIYIKEKN